jgi:hypothetical protein
MSYTLKVICITKGVSTGARVSTTLRDGWGTPKNCPREVSQQPESSEAPRDAA